MTLSDYLLRGAWPLHYPRLPAGVEPGDRWAGSEDDEHRADRSAEARADLVRHALTPVRTVGGWATCEEGL